MLECVVNVSEGRDPGVLAAFARAAEGALLDLHADPWHNRAVLTLAGDRLGVALRRLASEVVARVDLSGHAGVHPRHGALDVVPFVPLDARDLPPGAPVCGDSEAVEARDGFATWAAEALELPCYVYGPERSLPELRRAIAAGAAPDLGPGRAHPTAGVCCVGARRALVAYNLYLETHDPSVAARVAAAVRSPRLRTLGLLPGGRPQVSCNLVDPLVLGPAAAYDAVAGLAPVENAELVGLLPAAVLASIPPARFAELDVSPDRTIRARLSELASGD